MAKAQMAKQQNQQLNIRKIKTTIRQILTKISAFENCIIFHPFHAAEGLSAARGATPSSQDQVWKSQCQVSVPAKRHLKNFLEHFEEVVRTYSSPNTKECCVSLLDLASFQMGKIALEFDEEDFEDFYEDFYELAPIHTWRAVLISHLIHLVIKHVPLDYLMPQLADICIANSNYTQAFEIMTAFWIITKPTLKCEYSRALAMSKNMGKLGSWMRFLAYYIVTYDSEKEFLFEAIDVEGSGLKVAAIILSTEEYRNYDYRKTGLAVDYLVKHCCRRNHINYSIESCCCFSLLSKETKLLLESDTTALDARIIFALYFSGLVSNLDGIDNHRILMKLSLLLPQCTDLKVCISTFTPEQIEQVAKKAEVVEVGDIASALLVYNINQLRQTLRQSGEGNEDLIGRYESDLMRIQAHLKSELSWRYEVIADEWISNTPQKPMKIAFVETFSDGTKSVHRGTPLHRPVVINCDSPSSTNGRTPFRLTSQRKVDYLRSCGTDDDPLTAAFSVRIHRALNEKQRLKQAIRLASTPHLGRTNSHFTSLGSASPMVQQDRSPALRPPLGISTPSILNLRKGTAPCSKRARIEESIINESSDPLAHQERHVIVPLPPPQQISHSDIAQSEDDLLM